MTALTILAAPGASDGGGSGLGWLVLVGLLVWLLTRGGGKQIRWEYTKPNGQKAFTPWYDADTHYITLEPGKFTVHKRDGGPAKPYQGRVDS